MKFPPIEKFNNYKDYLQDFYTLNKKQGGSGSYRFYAQKLGWPVSYLNDVLQGRKKLSLARALEFGKFAKMDLVDLERFIYLSLKDSESEEVKSYFEKKIQAEKNTETYFQVSQKPENAGDDFIIIPERIFSDISLLAIFDLITWSNGSVKLSEIPELLYTFPELHKIDVLLEKIKILENEALITCVYSSKKEIIKFEYVKKRLLFSLTKETAHNMSQYAENYSRFLKHTEQRGWIGSGFLKLPKEKLAEVQKRILSLRNWLIEIDKEVLENPREKRDDVLLFQLDLNLFSLIAKTPLGQSDLKSWMLG
jgi:uncharacterized protein (TIGR02147 family)